MIVVTTAAVAGWRVVSTLGLVFGTAVRTRGIAGNIAAGMVALGQVNGDPLAEYAATLSEARDAALAQMAERAAALGANAVVAVRFDHATVEHEMGEIVAYGTAVIVAPEL